MIYGIIYLFIFACVFSYFFADKWLKVGKTDPLLLLDMEAANSRLYQFAENNLTFVKDCSIRVEIKNGKVVSVQTETKKSVKSLSFDEKDNPCVATTNTAWPLWVARVFTAITLFFLLLVIWFLI